MSQDDHEITTDPDVTPLSDILDDPQAQAQAQAPEGEAGAAQRAHDGTSQEPAPDAQDDAEPDSQQEPAAEHDPTVPLAALEDERHKRQELQRRMAEVEAQLETHSQSPRPDDNEDPAGAAQWDDASARANDMATRALTSQELMREHHADYDAAEALFIEEANRSPLLLAQFMEHPLPAKFAYDEGKRLLVLREIGGDPAAYRDRVRQEVRNELMQSTETMSNEVAGARRADVPQSLAEAPSAGSRDADERWQGPTPLSDIL